jgi:hypothetical protein
MGNELPVIYLAAPWKRREEAKLARDKFVAAGFKVNGEWLDVEVELQADGYTSSPDVMRREAMRDVKNVLNSQIVVVLNLELSEGKAVETGIAIAACKGIIIVGERLNVFQYLDMPRVDTVDEAIELAKNYPWKQGQEEFAGAN